MTLPHVAGEGGRLRVLDLFSGIGAYSLGLERTGGFETVAFCEINAFCRRILKQHWPHVPIFEDVTALTDANLRAAGAFPNWIVAGWPCQDISAAGTGVGLDGARSGLWSEIGRLAGELRPEGLLLENSSNLLNINGGADFGRVLGDLAALGYDAEWHCIPAAAVDAPHIRDRVWVVAYPHGGCVHQLGADRGDGGTVPPQGLERLIHRSDGCESALAHADRLAVVGSAIARQERHPWPAEPAVDRVVDGVPRRLVQPQLKALGNAVVPQIPELIGRAILAARAAA